MITLLRFTGVGLCIVLFPIFAHAQYKGTASVAMGRAVTIIDNLYPCSSGRIAGIGTITASDKTIWTVPAAVNFTNSTFPFAPDLYNPCNGATFPNAAAALAALDDSDIVIIDPSGKIVTAYIFADNYFEMYINGVPTGKDKVPFTQFNSSIVRFRVKRPFTIAMKLVDWEENLGLGSENNGGFAYHPGDGGVVAVFVDEQNNIVATTNNDWKAQTYYTAPITDLSCPAENGTLRLSDNCSTQDSQDGSKYYALHWALPSYWMNPGFDDSQWPSASTFTNAMIGVNNKPAYTNFTSIFDDPTNDAQFIWSTNIVLDNEVIVRYTVPLLTDLQEEIGATGETYLYPNPVADQFHIAGAGKVQCIRVIDVLGTTVYSKRNSQESIPVEGLPAGVYCVVIDYSTYTLTKKLIIQ